jgi:3-methylfumaryl-CoA hydratase
MPVDETVRAACEAHVGRSRTVEDAMSPVPARRLEAVLDREPSAAVGDPLPPTWHWAYFADEVRQSDIGADGHERLGLFLPPVPFPRRMWAASEVAIHAPLVLGEPARRVSTIRAVEFKSGRSGDLCFLRIGHEFHQRGAVRVEEAQTVVYRDRGLPEAALRAPGDPVPEGFFVHDDMQLFRYSAVTHNGHRIHWDRAFCREVEGYPDLVVHGPLLATHLAEALRAGREAWPTRFAFRAVAPVFVTTPIRVEAEGGAGRILRSDGRKATVAEMAWD